jgi:hypothetical protein
MHHIYLLRRLGVYILDKICLSRIQVREHSRGNRIMEEHQLYKHCQVLFLQCKTTSSCNIWFNYFASINRANRYPERNPPNGTKCLCKSTHFKDGSLCTLSKYQFSLLHMFLFFVMLRRHYKLFNGLNFQSPSYTMFTNICITFIYYDA